MKSLTFSGDQGNYFSTLLERTHSEMNKEELERTQRELNDEVADCRTLIVLRRGQLEAIENLYIEKITQLHRVNRRLEDLKNI